MIEANGSSRVSKGCGDCSLHTIDSYAPVQACQGRAERAHVMPSAEQRVDRTDRQFGARLPMTGSVSKARTERPIRERLTAALARAIAPIDDRRKGFDTRISHLVPRS